MGDKRLGIGVADLSDLMYLVGGTWRDGRSHLARSCFDKVNGVGCWLSHTIGAVPHNWCCPTQLVPRTICWHRPLRSKHISCAKHLVCMHNPYAPPISFGGWHLACAFGGSHNPDHASYAPFAGTPRTICWHRLTVQTYILCKPPSLLAQPIHPT
jgi:hypothetical protein